MAWRRPPAMVTVVVVTALVGAVPVLLLVVATAWLLSNRSDIESRPRPAVLHLPAPTLPDERNVFFALTGLSAEAAVSVEPLHCKGGAAGCLAEWLAAPAALAVQRAQMSAVGARCDGLAVPGMEFEERLPTQAPHAANIAPHLSGALQCSNWWRSGAVLAWQQGQPQQSLALLQRATWLDAALLAGSHSPIANRVAATVSRDTQHTVAGLAMVDPSLAPQLAPLLVSVPDAVQVAAVKRWIAYEAAVQQSSLAELAECLDPALALDQMPTGWAERQLEKLERWQCRHRVGFLPERNKALFDDFWVGVGATLGGGLPAAIEHLDMQVALATQRGWQWQNTLGQRLLDVAIPAYASYFRQAADLPLYSEAAALALAAAAQRVPPSERAAWAQRLPLSATLRERLQWDASGQGFTVRTWTEEGQTTPIEPRKAIRFAWHAPPQG